MPKKGKSSLEDRLHRIQGQIRGIEAMIESKDELEKIIIQLQAAISGLESVKLELIRSKIRNGLEEQLGKALALLK